jgi:hypothetical protein
MSETPQCPYEGCHHNHPEDVPHGGPPPDTRPRHRKGRPLSHTARVVIAWAVIVAAFGWLAAAVILKVPVWGVIVSGVVAVAVFVVMGRWPDGGQQ